jgi:hypothetical protein
MRHIEITHPYATTLRIEPEHLYDFRRLTQDSPDVALITVDDSDPDMLTLSIACTDYEVMRDMERGWN